MDIESHGDEPVDHVLDLLFLRAFLHYNNHRDFPSLSENSNRRFCGAGILPAGFPAWRNIRRPARKMPAPQEPDG
jgi:hypothetical protein